MNISEIYNKMQDDESRNIYNLKMEMYKNGTSTALIEGITELEKEWCLSEYDNCIENCRDKDVIIFGAGAYGKMTYKLLKGKGIEPFCFCDNSLDKQGKLYCGIPVIPVQDVKIKYRNAYVVLASQKFAPVFYKQLIDSYFPRENIWYPRIGALYATCGWQYFDCPTMLPVEGEVFLDCGCFDGDTSKQFIEWCNGKYDRIIAFEPDKNNYEVCENNCREVKNFTLYPNATGSHRGRINFNMRASGASKIDEAGQDEVHIETIDNILNDSKATFIKMDVEGAELESLKGARNTIEKYKPRLAICIYHKPEDIIEIPKFILSCRSDYKFYIRHYTSCTFETILYAL